MCLHCHPCLLVLWATDQQRHDDRKGLIYSTYRHTCKVTLRQTPKRKQHASKIQPSRRRLVWGLPTEQNINNTSNTRTLQGTTIARCCRGFRSFLALLNGSSHAPMSYIVFTTTLNYTPQNHATIHPTMQKKHYKKKLRSRLGKVRSGNENNSSLNKKQIPRVSVCLC